MLRRAVTSAVSAYGNAYTNVHAVRGGTQMQTAQIQARWMGAGAGPVPPRPARSEEVWKLSLPRVCVCGRAVNLDVAFGYALTRAFACICVCVCVWFACTDLQLVEEDELVWDDGNKYAEPCLDRFEMVSKVRAPLTSKEKHFDGDDDEEDFLFSWRRDADN